MPWTARLHEGATTVSNGVSIGILYTDGVQKWFRSYILTTIDDDGIKGIARNEIARLESLESSKSALTLRPGDVIDTTPPAAVTPKTPTTDEVARAEWFSNVRTLGQLRIALPNDQLTADKAAIVEATFKPEYLGL